MKPLDNLTAKEELIAKARDCIGKIQDISATAFNNLDDKISILTGIRGAAYENLNQLPHAYYILLAHDWLTTQKIFPEETIWEWNPHQTGGRGEPDLRGSLNGKILVSAEVTTSSRSTGTLKIHSDKTLKKLSGMEGALYYFTSNHSMYQSARKYAAIYSSIKVCLLKDGICIQD